CNEEKATTGRHGQFLSRVLTSEELARTRTGRAGIRRAKITATQHHEKLLNFALPATPSAQALPRRAFRIVSIMVNDCSTDAPISWNRSCFATVWWRPHTGGIVHADPAHPQDPGIRQA